MSYFHFKHWSSNIWNTYHQSGNGNLIVLWYSGELVWFPSIWLISVTTYNPKQCKICFDVTGLSQQYATLIIVSLMLGFFELKATGLFRLTFSYVFAISSTLNDFVWHCLFYHLSVIFFFLLGKSKILLYLVKRFNFYNRKLFSESSKICQSNQFQDLHIQQHRNLPDS